MLQGIILTQKSVDSIHDTASTSPHSDGSHSHVFLDGHHTGITIPLKYSSIENPPEQK